MVHVLSIALSLNKILTWTFNVVEIINKIRNYVMSWSVFVKSLINKASALIRAVKYSAENQFFPQFRKMLFVSTIFFELKFASNTYIWRTHAKVKVLSQKSIFCLIKNAFIVWALMSIRSFGSLKLFWQRYIVERWSFGTKFFLDTGIWFFRPEKRKIETTKKLGDSLEVPFLRTNFFDISWYKFFQRDEKWKFVPILLEVDEIPKF